MSGWDTYWKAQQADIAYRRKEERIEHFRCPPMPAELAADARRAGRLDHVTESGERVTREWYFDNLSRWRAANPLLCDQH